MTGRCPCCDATASGNVDVAAVGAFLSGTIVRAIGKPMAESLCAGHAAVLRALASRVAGQVAGRIAKASGNQEE